MSAVAPPSDRELRDGLERALAEVGLELVGGIERRPSPYRTSFPIEELRVDLAGRGEVRMGFKRLGWEDLEPTARLAKPRFLHDPGREPQVYRSLLAEAPPGPPELFGAVCQEHRHWLFFEWVEGRELFQVGDRALWEEAARWLARFHALHAPGLERHLRESRLIAHDADFYRRWTERARGFAAASGGSAERSVGWLAERHEQILEVLLELPRTVIHGEFYASNVLVAETKGGIRVAPVDWELAALAPGLTDLAALVGGWPAADREALVGAYASEPGGPGFTQRELDCARLQVAIQWLGWAPPEWEPPEGQRHDWLAEAVGLAEGLGL
jgi:thiamine kinase-like enzyme